MLKTASTHLTCIPWCSDFWLFPSTFSFMSSMYHLLAYHVIYVFIMCLYSILSRIQTPGGQHFLKHYNRSNASITIHDPIWHLMFIKLSSKILIILKILIIKNLLK
jgi:hypothetical protein